MGRITVLLLEDCTARDQGLSKVLSGEPDIEIVGKAGDSRDAISLAKAKRPTLVLLDLALPGLNGVETTRSLLAQTSGTKVIILTAVSESDSVRQAIEAGASGFLLKETSVPDLLRAIREVGKSDAASGPSKVSRPQARSPQDNPILTLREAHVLQLIAEGSPDREIAAEFGIAIETVEKHRQQMLQKLSAQCAAGLAGSRSFSSPMDLISRAWSGHYPATV